MDNNDIAFALQDATRAVIADVSGDTVLRSVPVRDLIPGQIVATREDTKRRSWNNPEITMNDALGGYSTYLYVVVSVTTARAVLDPITRPHLHTSWAAVESRGNRDSYERIGDAFARYVYPLGITLDELRTRVTASPAYPAYEEARAAAKAADDAFRAEQAAAYAEVEAVNAPYRAHAKAVNQALNWNRAVTVREVYYPTQTPGYTIGAPLHVLRAALDGKFLDPDQDAAASRALDAIAAAATIQEG